MFYSTGPGKTNLLLPLHLLIIFHAFLIAVKMQNAISFLIWKNIFKLCGRALGTTLSRFMH
jgi:hypothetical protein